MVQAVKGYDVRRGEDVQYLGEDSTSQLEARIVAMLLHAGADSTARDRLGCTPLILAAASGSVLVVKELLRHRSAAELSINVSTYWENNTAIGYAASYGFVEIARVLLDAGADPSVKNRKGMDAMDLARTPTPHMRSERYKDLTARRKRIVQMLRAHTSKLPPSGSGRVGSPANHEGWRRPEARGAVQTAGVVVFGACGVAPRAWGVVRVWVSSTVHRGQLRLGCRRSNCSARAGIHRRLPTPSVSRGHHRVQRKLYIQAACSSQSESEGSHLGSIPRYIPRYRRVRGLASRRGPVLAPSSPMEHE